MLRRNILSLSSGLQILCFYEIMVSTYDSTWRHIPEHRHFHRRENLKYHKSPYICYYIMLCHFLISKYLSKETKFLLRNSYPILHCSFCRTGYCLHYQGDHNRPDDGGSKHLRNVGKILRDYTAQHTRRQPLSQLKAISKSKWRERFYLTRVWVKYGL
jgi:hypothetical protein